MKNTVKIGYIGVGRRGSYMLKDCFGKMDDVEIITVCDNYKCNLDKVKDIFAELGKLLPILTLNADKIFENKEIDAVVIMTGWHEHISLAKKSHEVR